MTRTVWHFTMSLDGYLADERGSLDWMPVDGPPARLGLELIPTIGAVVAGRGTYDRGVTSEGSRAYGGAYAGPILVVTNRPHPDEAGIRFVTGLEAALRQARDLAGARTVVIFGAALGQACLAAGELDEVLVHVAPVLLGSGIRAFAGEAAPQTLQVLERSGADELTTLRLAPARRPGVSAS